MQQGTHVRHRVKPEWGVGVARENASGGKCRIQFEGYGIVTLDLAAARHHLDELSPEDVAAHLAAHPRPVGTSPITPHGSRCAHCKKPLHRSVYSSDKTWKSCPRCSIRDGAAHVFYEYPDGYGTSDARISDDAPDGAQSYCKTCRAGHEPTTHSRPCPPVKDEHAWHLRTA
jgi:hypothetical protein